MEGASTQQMHVQVRDRLTAVRTVVDHDAEAVRQTELTRQLTGHEQQVPEGRLVFGSGGGDARDARSARRRRRERRRGRVRYERIVYTA